MSMYVNHYPHITQVFDYVPILPTNLCKSPRRGSFIGLHLAIPNIIALTLRVGGQMWILSFPGNMEIILGCVHGHSGSTVSWAWTKFLQRRKGKCNVSREGRRTPTISEVISSTSAEISQWKISSFWLLQSWDGGTNGKVAQLWWTGVGGKHD